MRPLTERQLQVAHLIAAGHSRREVAEQLGISASCVSQYNQTIDAKLGLPYRPHGRPTKADRRTYLNKLQWAILKQSTV